MDVNVQKLSTAEEKEAQLEKQIAQKERQEEEQSLRLAQLELNSKAIEYMIVDEMKAIYSYE